MSAFAHSEQNIAANSSLGTTTLPPIAPPTTLSGRVTGNARYHSGVAISIAAPSRRPARLSLAVLSAVADAT